MTNSNTTVVTTTRTNFTTTTSNTMNTTMLTTTKSVIGGGNDNNPNNKDEGEEKKEEKEPSSLPSLSSSVKEHQQQQLQQQDEIIIQNIPVHVPILYEGEVRPGPTLGIGSFCEVRSIKYIRLKEGLNHNNNNHHHHHSHTTTTTTTTTSTKSNHHHHHQQSHFFHDTCPKRNRLAKMYAVTYTEQDPLSRPTRLAMKQIKEGILTSTNKKRYKIATKDLQLELQILQTVQHPHVIELHAIMVAKKNKNSDNNNNNNNEYTDNHHNRHNKNNNIKKDGKQNNNNNNINNINNHLMITSLVLTRIPTTLEQLLVKWRNQQHGTFGFHIPLPSFLLPSSSSHHHHQSHLQTQQNLWLERIIFLSKIASAMQCFHQHKIILRDLKPENVGIDDYGIPKLFDFGLAKPITKETKQQQQKQQQQKMKQTLNDGDNGNHNNNGSNDNTNASSSSTSTSTTSIDDIFHSLFLLTSQTGTLRYMAPEIYIDHQPYNAMVDSYSFGILMYQVLSLQVPYAGMPPSTFEQQVIYDGIRPTDINPSVIKFWPSSIQTIMTTLWNEQLDQRMTSIDLVQQLESILRGTSNHDLYPSNLLS